MNIAFWTILPMAKISTELNWNAQGRLRMYNFEALWRADLWLLLVKMTIFDDFHEFILTLTEEQGQQKTHFCTQGSLYYNHVQKYILSAKINFKVILTTHDLENRKWHIGTFTCL